VIHSKESLLTREKRIFFGFGRLDFAVLHLHAAGPDRILAQVFSPTGRQLFFSA
jgi:hypothetical protein